MLTETSALAKHTIPPYGALNSTCLGLQLVVPGDVALGPTLLDRAFRADVKA